MYERVLRTPEYVMFEPTTGAIEALTLSDGEYRAISADAHGRYPNRQLGLAFGLHEGQLRLFTTEGALLPTPEEAASAEAERASALADRLRALGHDPDRGL